MPDLLIATIVLPLLGAAFLPFLSRWGRGVARIDFEKSLEGGLCLVDDALGIQCVGETEQRHIVVRVIAQADQHGHGYRVVQLDAVLDQVYPKRRMHLGLHAFKPQRHVLG